MKKNYNLGLDIGTTSVGWAVTDCNTNKIMRKGNKKLWGVRLFEEAKTAEERRLARGNRRRFDRRRKRVQLLQKEFQAEINKVDSNFFTKLQETFYTEDDNCNKTITISREEKNQIKNYHKKYPTIYHLRNELMHTDEKMDIRFVYLALHHIIKYRGNFLFDFKNFNIKDLDIKKKLEEIFQNLYENCDTLEFSIDSLGMIDFEQLQNNILEVSKNDKKVKIKETLKNLLPKSFIDEFVKLVTGDSFSIAKLFQIDVETDLKISFKGSSYEDKYNDIETKFVEVLEFLDELKELYNMIFLKELFQGNEETSISALMVKKYKEHKEDLKNLKEVLHENKNCYHHIFRSTQKEKCIYEKYVHNALSYEEFIKELNKVLETVVSEIQKETILEKYNQIKEKMDCGTFMPRITDSDNGKYPYQLNMSELLQIIENQGKYYPFLLETTEDGIYKIARILEFRIPYYVGPLNNTTSNSKMQNKNAWAIKKEAGAIVTPYNFYDVIDIDRTAEEFITRMIGNCTYLLNEKVMASNSILYSKFKVLNELKQISVNGNRLSLEVQKQMYHELFLKENGTITEKKLKDYLRRNVNFNMYDDYNIIGFSAEHKFANNMQSYIDFFGPDGIFMDTPYQERDAEEIIRWITIFEDKSILERKVTKQYPKITPNNIKKIISKKYKGWSNLSEKLLTTNYYYDESTNTKKSIMDLMEETTQNFMQIINEEKYHFQDMMNELNEIKEGNILDYHLVEELATSPATKRGIYQTLKVIKELIDYMGYAPKNIVLEMARGDEKKVRKDDRKKMLENLYEKQKKGISNYQSLKKELSSFDKIDTQKLFLYFIQEGKSLYSGTPLNIQDLDRYEIDHIIPQTLIKDDSIDNKALVLREENQIKAANLVLPEQYRKDYMKGWWKHLNKIGLISSKKYHNLCRDKYSEKDIEGFINRQLVETRQITKHVANIVKTFYRESNVIYLPASLSHNYREKFELYKFREINDFHHAHDAYLAAVLGQYKATQLNKKITFELLKELNQKLLKEKRYKELHYGYVVNSLDNEFLQYDENGEILFYNETFNETVENTLYQNDILVSKKVEFKTGELYNQTKSKKGEKGVPLKKNLPIKKYGSYTSLNPAYATLVRYTKKGKEESRLIGIPIYIEVNPKKEIEKISYIRNLLQLSETDSIQIIKDKIPFYSKLDWEGQICYLVGATDKVEVCNAKEFKIDKEHMKLWKKTFVRLFERKEKIVDTNIYENQLEDIIRYIVLKIEKEYALYANLVDSMKEMFHVEDMKVLTLEQKENIIIQMFNLLKCNSTTANLKFLDSSYSMAFGRKKGLNIRHANIINQSITGIKENIYEF